MESDETGILIIVGKKESCLQDSPPAAGRGSDIFISAAVRSLGEFLFNRELRRNFLLNKKECQEPRYMRAPDIFVFISESLSSAALRVSSFLA